MSFDPISYLMGKQNGGGGSYEDATATSSDIRYPKTAYGANGKMTGLILDKEAETFTPTTTDQTIASGKYLAGNQVIKGDANLLATNIKKGVSLFDVVGTFNGGIELSSIEITTPPTKTEYYVGDTFDPTGMVILATYSNGATRNITNFSSGFVFTPSVIAADTSEVVVTLDESLVQKSSAQDTGMLIAIQNVAVASFSDAKANESLRELVIDITPQQSGGGNPHPQGTNIYNSATDTIGKTISENGTITDNTSGRISDYISVVAGETYTWSGKSGHDSSWMHRVHGYASNVWQQQITFASVRAGADFSIEFTVPTGISSIRLSFVQDDINDEVHMNANVRPISGWTGAHVTRASKNLFNPATITEHYYIAEDGTVIPFEDAKISDYIKVSPGKWILDSSKLPVGSVGNNRIHAYDANKNWIEQITVVSNRFRSDVLSIPITIPEGTVYIRFSMPLSTTGYTQYLQFERGEIATDYDAYSAETYAVSWQSEAGTVYGGTLTDNGDGTWTLVKTIGAPRDLSTMNWGYVDSMQCFAATFGSGTYKSKVISSAYGSTTPTSSNIGTDNIVGVVGGATIRLRDSRFGANDVTAFKAALVGVDFCMTLETPVEYDPITADSVKTLLGDNNIFADCGNINRLVYLTYPEHVITNVPIATFSDGADSVPVRELKINITPLQSGSGDPSPDNVREISGWTGAQIVRTGNNLADMASTNIVIGKYIDNSGVEQDNVANFYNSPFIRVHADSKYTASFSTAVNYFSIMEYDINHNFIVRTLFGASGTPSLTNCTLTTSSNTAFIRFGSNMNGIEITLGDVLAINWMLNSGESALSYEPFGTTYPVSWQTEAGVVAGGILRDNGDGTWTVSKTWTYIAMKTWQWSMNQNGIFTSDNIPAADNSIGETTLLLECYKGIPNLRLANFKSQANNFDACFETSGTPYVMLKDNRFTSLSDFLSYIDNKYMLLKRRTPIEHTLTAESVKTLLGDNNIFADCGDIAILRYCFEDDD